MKKFVQVYVLSLMFVFCISCNGQNRTDLPNSTGTENREVSTPYGPNSITRNILQDRKGVTWIASWEGIFRYDGKSFINMTRNVSSFRFFSVLEDKKGNLWFGSIGSGVFMYDGKSFRNFATTNGLLNNDVCSMHEDKAGNIWFGVFGGVSCYDGKSFRNFIIDENTMHEDHTGKTFAERPPYEVNSIIEDKAGRFWFATRGDTFIYNGKSFAVFAHDGQPFRNVRCTIEDRRGNIWTGGEDGLWRFDGTVYTQLTKAFTGYVYEDRKGNIWVSSESGPDKSWTLTRYDEKTLSGDKPVATTIRSNEGMVFGILEARDGSILYGTPNGLYRYDGRDNYKI